MLFVEDSKNVSMLVDDSIEFVDAAADGDVEKVKKMIGTGTNPNTQGPKGWTALRKAAVRNKYEVAFELLNAGASVDATNYTGQTALMMGCAYDRREMVSLLLLHGADINFANCSGRTPLMTAASNGLKEVVGILLGSLKYIDFEKIDKSGKTALQMALESSHNDIVQMLVFAGAKPFTGDCLASVDNFQTVLIGDVLR